MQVTIRKPVFGPLLSGELKKLKAAGVDPTPEEVVWLWQMCNVAIRPTMRATSQVFALPVRVGKDLYLYSPVWAARLWFDDICRPAMEGMSPDFRVLTYGFYYSIGSKVNIIEKLLTRTDIIRAVTAWGRNLKTVSLDELQEGIALITGDTEDTEAIEIEDGRKPVIKDHGPLDHGELAAFLCHYYEVNPAELATVPEAMIENMIDALPVIMQNEHPVDGRMIDEPDQRAWWLMTRVREYIKKAHMPEPIAEVTHE